MIHLVVGHDAYKRRQTVSKIIDAAHLTPEKFDGVDLTENQLADCIAGATLFSNERLIVISDLSANKPLWDKLADWTGRVSGDTTLVLVEPAVDKRTKAYKVIAKAATLHTADPWSDRQTGEAVRWTAQRAKELGTTLNADQAGSLVARATAMGDRPGSYTIDQQQLEGALHSLSVLDTVTDDAISAVLPESSADNVFELIDVALGGNKTRVMQLLHNLHATADPYMTLGYIISQWSQLVALKIANESPDNLAEKIGASPFVLKKLQKHAALLPYSSVKELTDLLVKLDVKIKTTGIDPWVATDRFIGELCN